MFTVAATSADIAAALSYHERTKHSPASVRRAGRPLDWDNRPHPFKEYVGLAPEPLPARLERLLRLGAGVVRTRSGPDAYHFRTYSSAGALYPVEVYVADRGGVYHYHPLEHTLRRLREIDVRAALTDESAETILVLTGILWRTAWKYGPRGYRHLFWDAGTMVANLLALAPEARVLTGFVDAEVNAAVGADGEREAALALLALGSAEPAEPADSPAPLELRSKPLSAREETYPQVYADHAATGLADGEEVRRYRRAAPGTIAREAPIADLEGVLRRRGSVREFGLDPIARSALAEILARAAAPIPADVPPFAETYVVANAVDGLAPGAYRFEAPGGFELLRGGSFRRAAGYLALEQELGARAAAVVFFLADLERVLATLGGRGYRAVQLEGGIRTGRVYLGAVAARLAATASTFYDDEVTAFFAPGTAKTPLLCVAVGPRP